MSGNVLDAAFGRANEAAEAKRRAKAFIVKVAGGDPRLQVRLTPFEFPCSFPSYRCARCACVCVSGSGR